MELMTSRGVSKRSACRYLGVSRRVAHYELKQPQKDCALAGRLMNTSHQYPRLGYRRTAVWLEEGVCRVHRLWKQLGLNLPRRRPRRRRCGTDMRLPGATRPNAGVELRLRS